MEKILIFRNEHIGDYGLSLPALRTIRENYPHAQIDIVVGPWNKELAEATPFVDNIIIYDCPLIKRHVSYFDFINPLNIIKILKFLKKIRETHYDILISFSNRKFNVIYTRFIKSKQVFTGRKFGYEFGSERERLPRIMTHYGLRNIRLSADLNYSKKDKEIVNGIIQKNKLSNKKIILIHPVTPLKEKNWSFSNWREFIGLCLKKDPSITFGLLGTSSQKNDLESLISLETKKSVLNLAGKISIVQMILLIKKSDLIVGSDSGPVHLAEITNTPIAVLFGPTNVQMWGPPTKQGIVIQEKDVASISPKKVFEACQKFI